VLVAVAVGVGVAAVLVCVGLLVGADWHVFNAAETALMMQLTVT
jgi:hypothetical protein